MIPFTISKELWDFIIFMGGDPTRLDYYGAKEWEREMDEWYADMYHESDSYYHGVNG